MKKRYSFLFVVLIFTCVICNIKLPGVLVFNEEEFQEQRIKGKIPQPETLEEFASQVKSMKNPGADSSEIAEHISKVVNKTARENQSSFFSVFSLPLWQMRL